MPASSAKASCDSSCSRRSLRRLRAKTSLAVPACDVSFMDHKDPDQRDVKPPPILAIMPTIVNIDKTITAILMVMGDATSP